MRLFLMLGIALFLVACGGKNPIAPDLNKPSIARRSPVVQPGTWIEKEIMRVENLPLEQQPARIEQCTFKKQLVFIFKSEMPGTPDTQIPIYGEAGDTVCLLGGLSCTTLCDSIDFLEARSDLSIIWKKQISND